MEGDGVDGEGRGDKERMEGGRWIIISNKTAVKPCPDFKSRAVNSGHILNSYFGYYSSACSDVIAHKNNIQSKILPGFVEPTLRWSDFWSDVLVHVSFLGVRVYL